MSKIIFFAIVFELIFFKSIYGQNLENPPVVVFSIDSFRWDFIYRIKNLTQSRYRLSNLWKLIDKGTYAPNGVEPLSITESFSNQYAMVTGLYAGNHGIVTGDKIFDPVRNRSVNLKSINCVEDDWIFDGEPIWKTLKGDNPVGCYMWFGCQCENLKYNVAIGNTIWNDRVDTTIDWLKNGVKLILIDYSDFDQLVRVEGPNSDSADEALLAIDDHLGYLIKKLQVENLFEQINLIISSDHGVTESINGTGILSQADTEQFFFTVKSQGETVWFVEPIPAYEPDTIAYFRQYDHLKVYKKSELPDQWHKNQIGIPPIIVLADPGYSLHGNYKGLYGYANDVNDMRPTFIAHGPSFLPNSTVSESMKSVDIYGLLGFLLNVTTKSNYSTNISKEHFIKLYVRKPLTTADPPENLALFVTVIVLAIALNLGALIIAWLCCASRILPSQNDDKDDMNQTIDDDTKIVSEKTPLLA